MRIKHLKLDCANLDEQKYFYTRKFNFKVVEESDSSLSLQMGDSVLTFSENRLNKAYYHFALNVPYGTINKALNWVKKKVPVISSDDGQIQNFNAWQARALYFMDPAGNIVELIGRQRFNESNCNSFNESKVLNISEVGLPVLEVSSVRKLIKKGTGVQRFDCRSNTFCALGNDEGLLILVDKAEKTWFPTDEPARSFNLEIDFEEGERNYQLLYFSGEMNLTEKKREKA